MLGGVSIKMCLYMSIAFSIVYMRNPENSVVRSLHFSVFHKRIIVSGPHLSPFLYLPDINQSKCHVSKCGICWGIENSWLIPHSSAKLSLPLILPLQQCVHQPESSSMKKSDTGPSFEPFAVLLNQIL